MSDDLRAQRAQRIYQSKLAEGRYVALQLCKDKKIPTKTGTIETFAIGYVAGFLAGVEKGQKREAKLETET